jgi:hypothetical protein
VTCDVVQVVNDTVYRVCDDDFNVYIIEVPPNSGLKILEGDSLYVKGTYRGIRTYEMTNGAVREFPYIVADEYEILGLD